MPKKSGAPNPNKSLAALLHATNQVPHTGMSDTIPAQIDGQVPAALSQGEYVIPADVVSMLGDGDTSAGSKILDGMIAKIREMKQGHSEQGPMMKDALSKLLNPK